LGYVSRNLNQVETLMSDVERYGYYLGAALTDTIYRTRDDRTYCKEPCIRLSGPKLGSSSKGKQVNTKRKNQDASKRNAIEGKFGEASAVMD